MTFPIIYSKTSLSGINSVQAAAVVYDDFLVLCKPAAIVEKKTYLDERVTFEGHDAHLLDLWRRLSPSKGLRLTHN